MSGRVAVAVLGVGEHGKKHARALQQLAGAELVGVYDLRPERAGELAAEFGVRAFASLDEVWEAVRAVSVVIPTTSHAEVARQAFAHGVDVLLEKPITRTLEEAEEVTALAQGRGRILQVGHLERFNPGVVAAKAITRQPLFFEIHRMGVFSPRSLDVDVVFDLMIHDLDLVLWLVNSSRAKCERWGCRCSPIKWISPMPGWSLNAARWRTSPPAAPARNGFGSSAISNPTSMFPLILRDAMRRFCG